MPPIKKKLSFLSHSVSPDASSLPAPYASPDASISVVSSPLSLSLSPSPSLLTWLLLSPSSVSPFALPCFLSRCRGAPAGEQRRATQWCTGPSGPLQVLAAAAATPLRLALVSPRALLGSKP